MIETFDFAGYRFDYKFFVYKAEDWQKALTKDEFRQLLALNSKYEEYRKKHGKDPSPNYLVVNTDEQYAPIIAAIIAENEGLEGREV